MDPKIIDKVFLKIASPDEARLVAKWFATDEGQEHFSQRYDRESYLLNEKIITEWSDHGVPTDRMKIRFILNSISYTYLRLLIKTKLSFLLFNSCSWRLTSLSI